MDVAPPIPRCQKGDSGFRSEQAGINGDGERIEQGPYSYFVADSGLRDRHTDGNPLAGQIPLQFADLGPVSHYHRHLGQVPAVVDVLVKDPLGNITEFVHGGRHEVGFHRSLRPLPQRLELPGSCPPARWEIRPATPSHASVSPGGVAVRIPEGTFQDGGTR
jgi:hypothetical protein